MIKFFRHIRKSLLMVNKTSKYFKYAIGEIVLVVIGILIALQINIWNEQKKEQKIVESYLKNLVVDLNEDIKMTESLVVRIKYKVLYIDKLATFFRNKDIKELDNLEVFYEAYDNYGYKPFTWYKSTIDEIKNSGSLKLIKNDSLRKQINQYYALTDHLDQDFINDSETATSLRTSLFNIVNTNYPNRKDLIDTLNLSYKKSDKPIFTNSKVYKEARKNNFKLLTNDINDIHVFVNNLFRYNNLLNVRYKSEFPRLIKMGENIIESIEKEYND